MYYIFFFEKTVKFFFSRQIFFSDNLFFKKRIEQKR